MHSEMMKTFRTLDGSEDATVREVLAVGKELGVSASQVALAWLRARPVPTIPIIDPRKVQQVDDNLASVNLTLSPEQLTRLDQASAVRLGFPHDFLAMPAAQAIVFGSLRHRIKA